MKKLVSALLCALLLAAALLAGGCGDKSELRAVTLNEVTRSVFYAPLYCGITLGYFKEEGLAIEVVTGGGSDKSMTALLSGDAEIALMGPETGVYVKNQGQENHPMIIAQLTKRDGSFLMGRTAEPDFKWENLRGKTIIGGRPGGMPFMTLCYVLKSHGLVPGQDVTVIDNIQFPLMGGAFDSGTGDYVTLFEPTASEFAKLGKGYIVAAVGLESGEVPYTAFMVRQETIKDDADFVAAFVRALYKAQQWVWAATDAEVAEAMAPFFPDSSAETLAAVAKSYRDADAWTDTPVMTEDAFTRLQDIIEGSGELSARLNLNDLVDNAFAQAAVNGK